jgi:hypothetical protein
LTAINPRPGRPVHSGCMAIRRIAPLVLACALAGCAGLLPRGTSDTPTPFASYEEARAATERVVPFRTRTGELKALGFDVQAGRNVTLIPYPEIVARLAPHSGVPLDALEPGIRECILARTDCRAYAFRFERIDRTREGPFLADFVNVRRVTRVTGWSFDALIVVAGDRVLFRNYAGQAHIDRLERQINPLGPFQSGEALLR